ncbi:proline-specific peptidase [Salinigranum rubrum]|uniref:Proline iminopeptidase n=1 Tax=Salinigranum rubrum TaxID=755307 RepID=A0A2I8VQ55_9EURY|nr:proline iminopeptidase-family hydrolase [Salinigranum rubrum]AUV84035.1 proline-specific peptidase [Salinigranum rubrum]
MTTTDDYFGRDHDEEYLDVGGYELFYRRFGSGDETLVGLHGGPGVPHDYLAPLAAHGTDRRSVYLYDQFGVGRSDGPATGDFDRYTAEHYRDELEAFRVALGVDRLHLYGHSWGGMLALEYALAYPDRVASLVLANAFADANAAHAGIRATVETLSEESREAIATHEASRTFDAPEFQAAVMELIGEHVCRADPFPDPVSRAFEEMNHDIYGLMWGPTEFVLAETARLRGRSVTDRLDEIDVPTLVLTGTYDELTPELARDLASALPDAELVEFEASSHTPFWEQPDEHREAVEAFLHRVTPVRQ